MATKDAIILAANGTSEVIYVTIVIDTDTVITNYPNPSQDPQNPTGIAHDLGFLVTSREYVVSGNGTGDLNIKAEVGDTLRWTSMSESDNMDTAVFTYAFNQSGGTKVTGNVTLDTFTTQSMFPTSANPPQVNQINQNYWFMTCNITDNGTESYTVNFGLYRRTRGVPGQALFGYFYWDPTLTVGQPIKPTQG